MKRTPSRRRTPSSARTRRPVGGRAAGPLSGYRVVELAHHLAGPLGAMHLGDFGADVVKVETLEGEDWRRWGRPSPAGDSQLFLAISRNKRSLSLDFASVAGRAVLDRLLASADVLLTNYQPGLLRRMRLDARSLARRFPRLIVCSMSAFGTRGPDPDRRAFDLIAGGETGLLLLPEGAPAPLLNVAPVADTAGALLLAYGVALALLHRERTGRAQAVETALANACIALQAHRFIWLDGQPAPDVTPPRTIMYRAYATADGFITVAVIAERLWRRLCGALGLAHVADDPRHADWSKVIEWQAELRETFEARFRERTTEAWLKTLIEAGVPAGRVQWGAPVFEHPQLVANDVVIRTRDPRAGSMRTMGFPLALRATPARVRRHAPALGADSRAVLAELGFTAAEVRRLIADRVVRARS
jgi:crotonobetainyl-CoA:carnitine CoA-transferase CaiB-like acyl-CoA transferase